MNLKPVYLALLAFLFTFAVVVVATDVKANAAGTDCYHEADQSWCVRIQIAGHRGNEGVNENTLRALRLDDRWGADYETDQWNLADGTPVILHDDTLARTVDPASMPRGVTPRSHPHQLTLWQWRQLRTFGGEPLPTERQWIGLAARLGVAGMIESKWAHTPERAAAIARFSRRVGADVSWYSLAHKDCQARAVKAMQAVGMPVGLKDYPTCPITLDQAAAFGYSYVVTAASKLTPRYVSRAHRLGLTVAPYRANRALWPAMVNVHVDTLIVRHVRPAERWVG